MNNDTAAALLRPDKAILLTGATGVVGSALLPELRDLPVTCLVHRKSPASPGVSRVHGDLRLPRLGLGERPFRALAGRVGAVVHCAAMTGFGGDAAATAELNIRGTAHVLELAAAAGAPLYHVSTAFVTRAQTRAGAGACAAHGLRSPDAYLASKLAAEDLVRASGVDAVIVRPSLVIGHSETGWTKTFQGLHLITGAVMKGLMPIAPVDPAARIDFIPQDTLARGIAALVRAGEIRGEYWLTAGAAAPTALEVMDVCVEVARRRGYDPVTPRLVAPEVVDRLLRPVFLAHLPPPLRRRFEAMLDLVDLIATDEPFPSSLPGAAGLLGVDPSPAGLDVLTHSLEHWADRKGMPAAIPLGVAA